MENVYLIVLEHLGKHYLAGTTEGTIAAYKTLDETAKKFEGFYRSAASTDYSTHVSAAFGIINIRPRIIKAPSEEPEWLREYVIGTKMVTISGFGFVPMNNMIPVKPEIVQFSILDISKDVMESIYGPLDKEKDEFKKQK